MSIQPIRFSAIKKKDGEVCVGPDEILCRWREHFEGVLNAYDQATLDAVEQLPLRHELSEPPDRNETLRALGKLTLDRAGDLNGLLPDGLKCCGGPLYLLCSRLYGMGGVCPQSGEMLC